MARMNNESSWQVVAMRQLLLTIKNGTTQKQNTERLGLPVTRIETISNGVIDPERLGWVEIYDQDFSEFELKIGDILFSHINSLEHLGKCAIYEGVPPNFLHGMNLLLLRCNTKLILPEYLLYYLRSQSALHEIRSRAGQAVNQASINQSALGTVPVPLPPLPEQQRIVAILRRADKLRQLRRQANRRAQDLLPALFQVMFGEFDGNQDYEHAKLEQIADVVSGVTKGRKFSGQKPVTVPYLRVANVQDGYLDLEEIKSIEALPSEVELYRLQKGDVLLTEGGDFDKLGRGAIWNADIIDCIHQNHIFRVRLEQEIMLPAVFAQFLRTPHTKAYFLRAAKQTTNLASINMTQLRALPVPLIQMNKQQEFIRRAATISKIQLQLSASEAAFQNLFQSILPRAFTGELTAAWREVHLDELAQAAAERDRLLDEQSQTLSISVSDSVRVDESVNTRVQQAIAIDLEVIRKRQTILDTLSPAQRGLLAIIYASEGYVTIQTLTLDENDQRTLQLLAAAGLIQSVSVPTNPSGQTVYGDAYRALAADDDVRLSDLALLQSQQAEQGAGA